MKKRFIVVVLMLLAVFTLVACGEDVDPVETLTAITFSGVDDVTLDFEEPFNVMDGVTAKGNNGVDYTSEITYTHANTVIITDDVLDTTVTGAQAIKYEVEVDGILAQKFRMVTVKSPEAVEGQMLINADFEQGPAGWNDSSVVYEADGGTIVLSGDEGALKAEVVAGVNSYTPRFGQMNVPFDNDVTYEISFDAKSSVEKTINLQVGELLSGAPYFTDFKTGLTVHKTITTEWETYSFKFTMNQDEENHRGGLLFELGALGGNQIDATMWFDNVVIEEATPDPDETAPAFTGLAESKSILVNGSFDPMAGVTAFDVVDGDVSEDIAVVIKNEADEVVTTIDTSVEATYTLTYTVSDAAGNEAEFIMTLEVVGMQFNETNLIVNGNFEAALGDPSEWEVYTENAAFVTASGIDDENNVFSITTAGAGAGNPYDVKLMQSNLTLVEGKTYRVTLVMKASAARTVNVALGIPFTVDPWWDEYARFNTVELTTEYQTFEFLFTATKATSSDIQLVIEMGNTGGYVDGDVIFDEILLQEALLDDIIMNGQMDHGWELWFQDWGDAPTVTLDRTNGTFDLTIDKAGEAFWAVQFNQLVDLEAAKTYTLSFDAKATAARNINVEVLGTSLLGDAKADFNLTTEMQTFTVDVVTVDAVNGAKLSFELGNTGSFAAGTVSLDNISIKEKDVAEAPELVVNGDATTVPYFTYDNSGSGQGTMVLGENGAVVDVTALGGEAYTPHFYQMLDGLTPGDYVLKLVIDSTVDRDLRVNMVLPDAGYASIFPEGSVDFEVISTETNVVYVSFTVTNAVTNVKLELDFGTLGGELTSVIGVFTIQEVLVYQDLN